MQRKNLPRWILALLAGLTMLAPATLAQDDDDDDDCDEECTPCEETTVALRRAGQNEASDDFWVGQAKCLNLTRRADRMACFADNRSAFLEAVAFVQEQFEARLELCEDLGGDRYDPRIDSANFVKGVTNPFRPLVPGKTLVYQKVTDEGLETVEVTTTRETKTILGVECVVVRDVVMRGDELVEDTLDYFAQDRAGNVWYFGEFVMNFEDGALANLNGSWTAGVDGAKPGIVMKATPTVGNVYRQEFLATEAEDAARVTGKNRTVVVPKGTFTGCLETLDFTPLEPTHLEAKFYAPGLGFVLEVNLESGERTELVAIR